MKHFFVLLIFLYTPFIYSQSSIDVGSGATIDIGAGADITADSRSGTFTGTGTWNGGALPVELTSFTASINGITVNLKWETATEVNNYGFEIERVSIYPSPYQGDGGDDGRGWVKLGLVLGHGNSNSPKNYSFTDKPANGIAFKYRLKQIDVDGKFEYSNQVEVYFDSKFLSFELNQNYPNPFNPNTKISYSISTSSFVSLTVYDVLGKEVLTIVKGEMQAGYHEIEFNGSNLASGVYYYQLRSNNLSETKKFILTK